MSHYSDIGFDIKSQEEMEELHNKIMFGKIGKHSGYDVSKNRLLKKDKTYYYYYKIGQIVFCFTANIKSKDILTVSFSHYNENVSQVLYDKVSSVKTPMLIDGDFPTIEVVKDDLPVWFSCVNYDVFKSQLKVGKKKLNLRIASFANNIYFKEPLKNDSPVGKPLSQDEIINNLKNGKIKLGDESYLAEWNENPAYATVSGKIKGFKLEENELTKNKYYAIDIDCLGLDFKVLADPKIVDTQYLKVGNIAYGNFWNTAIIVNPDDEEAF